MNTPNDRKLEIDANTPSAESPEWGAGLTILVVAAASSTILYRFLATS